MTNNAPVLYNKYSTYLKEKYRERIQKVTIDAGFTCPNRDGNLGHGGCTYCNNESFSPATKLTKLPVREQVTTGIENLKRRYKAKKFFAYFQSYSNTYAPLERLKVLYEEALSHPDIVGIAIGTRPDCVDSYKLDYLQELSKEYDVTVEYGLESISNDTLERINRGHDLESYLKAMEATNRRDIKTCTHIILGFPWEDDDLWIESARLLSTVHTTFLKIHQLHVVKNTKMGSDYLKRPFKTLSENEYLEVLCDFLPHLDKKIIIQRLFGDAPQEMLLSPAWQKNSSELQTELEKLLIKRELFQGKFL